MNRDLETLARRVRAARKHRGLSQDDLAEATGMQQSVISKIELGNILQTTGIARLATALNVPANWLEQGVGPEPDWLNEQHSLGGSGMSVAHLMSHHKQMIDLPEIKWESILVAPLPERFTLIIRDNSMSIAGQRGLDVGSRATFQRAAEARPGDDALIADADGNVYIRMYQERRPGHWLAVARNSAFQPLDSKIDGLRVLGILKGFEWE